MSEVDLHTALRVHFNFPAFRPGQAEALAHVLNVQHALVVMPTGSFSASSHSVGLSWQPISDPAFSHYRVYRAGGAGDWELLAETTQTAYADPTLQSGVTYRYAVSAVSTAGVGSPLSMEVIVPTTQTVYLPLIRR